MPAHFDDSYGVMWPALKKGNIKGLVHEDSMPVYDHETMNLIDPQDIKSYSRPEK